MPAPAAPPAPAVAPSIVQQLTDGGLITPDQAAQLTALGDTAGPDLTLLADHLASEISRLVGPDPDPDGDPAAVPEMTDDALAAATCAADCRDAIDAELGRRRADRAAVLTRLRATEPTAPAGTPPRPPAARTGRVAARGIAQGRSGAGATVLTASGRPIGREQLGGELAEAFRQVMAGPSPFVGRRVVATERATYPEHRQLGQDPNVNRARIEGVTSPEALVASGGMCAPSAVLYSFDTLASSARPVRDALAHFGADRGGVRTFPAIELLDVEAGAGVWTNADDIAAADTVTPGDNPVKACITIDCPTDVETLVQAITMCVRFGNFRQRFFPEQIDAVMQTLAGAHARLAESTLLSTMVASSVAVTTGQVLGAARDVLELLDRAIAAMRARQRLDEQQRLHLVAPSWLRQMMRADIVRELPGRPAEPLATADATIAEFFAVRGTTPTWSLDFDTAWATQATGALTAWPATARLLLYPEGSWLFLDGGSLDLGVIRDSTLAATNDAMAFSETFEAATLIGAESLAITATVKVTGATSGSVAIP